MESSAYAPERPQPEAPLICKLQTIETPVQTGVFYFSSILYILPEPENPTGLAWWGPVL